MEEIHQWAFCQYSQIKNTIPPSSTITKSDLAYRLRIPELLRLSDRVQDTVSRLQANSNVYLTLHALAAEAGIM